MQKQQLPQGQKGQSQHRTGHDGAGPPRVDPSGLGFLGIDCPFGETDSGGCNSAQYAAEATGVATGTIAAVSCGATFGVATPGFGAAACGVLGGTFGTLNARGVERIHDG
jgi:hypothetical protein